MFAAVRKFFFLAVAIIAGICSARAQFAPAADLPGTTAIYKDSSIFTEWASGCIVRRGYMNIADTALGYASAGADSCGTGKAGENGVISLGDGGTATLTFDYPIYNGDGFDFAVFENGFMTNDSNLAFLELAFVEVSSDGTNFFRFPSISNTQDTLQCAPFGPTDASQLYDLAGKYVANYGTPFDLDELKDEQGLDVNNITYVRIIDVVGSVDSLYATRDSKGNIVNDPWPTPFASCGFDLDAVGVINAHVPNVVNTISIPQARVYPNPVNSYSKVCINTASNIIGSNIYGLTGFVPKRMEITQEGSNNTYFFSVPELAAGMYFLIIETDDGVITTKLIVE